MATMTRPGKGLADAQRFDRGTERVDEPVRDEGGGAAAGGENADRGAERPCMLARMRFSRQRALPLTEHRLGEHNENEKKHDRADDGELLLMRAARQVQLLRERRQHQRRHRQQKQRRDHPRRLTFEVKHAEPPAAG